MKIAEVGEDGGRLVKEGCFLRVSNICHKLRIIVQNGRRRCFIL